jgi:Fe2+ or Zn2+ uptake regulation protein
MVRALGDAGYRLTRPRLAIIDVLQTSNERLSPEEIYHRSKAIHGALGLVTVYRTLEILNDLGLVRRVHTRGHCHDYARAQGDRHYLVCRRCDQIVEFPCGGLDDLVEAVQERTGYAVDTHLLELSGVCPSCQEKTV